MSAAPATVPCRPGTPFSGVRTDVVVAGAFVAATLAWATIDGLPGGRWLAVHLFTLGVLTPLIVAFSHHQATALLRVPDRGRRLQRTVLVGGALLLVTGVATAYLPAIAAGATANAGAVFASWWRLRRDRKVALGPRFGWMVRAYERAHGAYLHGALLGALLGVGLVPGTAYVAVRQAHLHAMLLGFAAVTLLTTAVLYGPMLLRAQLPPTLEGRARRAVGASATAATVAVLALLGRALPGIWGEASRYLAALALGLAAVGAGAIAVGLVRVAIAKPGRPPLAGVLLVAAVAWLTLGIGLDAVVVAAGAWRWHDPLGLVVLVGALGQAILATLLHVVTVWLPRRRRLRIWARLDALPLWLAAVPQAVVLAVALAAVR